MSWSGDSENYRYAGTDDLGPIVEMLQDPEVGRWLWFCPITPVDARAYFAPLLEGQAADLAVGRVPEKAVFTVEDRGGSFLGQGAVVAVEGSPGGFEIGYQFRREAWGRGVGLRFGRFLAAFAVHVAGAYRIEASCLEGNLGSRRILERLGLEREGRRSGYRLKDGARHVELLYGSEVARLDAEALRASAQRLGLTGSPAE